MEHKKVNQLVVYGDRDLDCRFRVPNHYCSVVPFMIHTSTGVALNTDREAYITSRLSRTSQNCFAL